MTEVTPERLAEIEARTWEATQGPWRWHWRHDDSNWPGSIFAEPRTGHAYAVAMCPRYGKESFAADADFIAHARQDIPDLIAELRKARERIEKLESDNFDLEELLGVSEGQVNDLQNERAQHHEAQNAD